MFGSHRQYVLMVPAVLQNDSPGQVCLQFLNLNETISVRVILEYSSVSTTIFKKTVTANSGLQCFNFKIPPVHSAPLAFISFSAKGTTISLEERRSVMIWNTDSIVFVQTDKPIYRPGQTDFQGKKPVSLYSFFLQDPRGNRIFQWQNVKSEMNIIQLEFPLTEEPILGNYKIIVAKNSVLVLDLFLSQTSSVHISSSPRYTYGQPVEGKVQLSVCRDFDSYGRCKKSPVCQSVTTNVISITQVMSTIQFENMDHHYRRGIPYFGQIKLVDKDNSPISNEVIQLFVNNKNTDNFTTDHKGVAEFSIDTSEMFDPEISLKAIYKTSDHCHYEGWIEPYYPEASLSVQRFYSWTSSFVRIGPLWKDLKCGQKRMITVHYVLNTEGYRSINAMNFYYVVSRRLWVGLLKGLYWAAIWQSIHRNYSSESSSWYSLPLSSLPFASEMAPALRLLVYTLHPDKELVADSVQLPVEKCFKNKVHLEFSEKQMNPASNVSLVIEAAANSFCAVRAMDQSVLLLKPETELTTEMVSCQMPYFQGYIFQGFNLEEDSQEPCVSSDHIFHKGLYYTPVMSGLGPDVYQILRLEGNGKTLIVLHTSPCTFKPVLSGSLCSVNQVLLNSHYLLPAEAGREERERRLILETIREFFPEAWIWDIVQINSTGKASISYTIPDTITKWKASAFCVEELAGFGTSVPATLTALQPFFVDLTLPYSIIRGEDFLLRATVFNYLDQCIKVQTVHELVNCCFNPPVLSCSRLGKGVAFLSLNFFCMLLSHPLPVSPLSISMQPEGIRREKTQNSLICTEGKVVLIPPPISCSPGDIMGTAMQNLHQLLQMPFGCGEQNMVLFAPNIYVLDYLNKTGQLSEEVKSKATGYLVSGYQKQLSYKHPDGSYSIFGTRDKEGNTWLTAFVYRSFAQAGHLIYIDDSVQSQTLMWLASKQKTEGCFQSVGTLFNNALKGGVDDELSLSAYITIAILEAGHSSLYPVIRNAFFCLETASEKRISDVYTQALMAYAFCLAGKAEKCESFLAELQKSAKEERSPSDKSPSFLDHAPSAEVEITSYVLLALLYKPNRNKDDLTKASGIVQWLIRQQNPYGGFSSTQDTVIALQALAAYGEATYNSASQNRVKITSKKPFENVFIVNNENRLLLQQTPLPEVPGKYSLTMNGSGCVFVQTALRYNIHLPEGYFGFLLSVQTPNASLSQRTTDRALCCFSYTGKRSSSNMLIIDVKMLSGFVPVKSSLDKLIDSHAVMQVENKKNHVLFYLQNVRWKQHVIGITIIWIYPIRCIYHVLFLISFLL
uniref:Uncharacterized protein n=1 Tax=Corvus moneduloides TaxID=1196302 RepID=A0A8U7M233_CORMO